MPSACAHTRGSAAAAGLGGDESPLWAKVLLPSPRDNAGQGWEAGAGRQRVPTPPPAQRQGRASDSLCPRTSDKRLVTISCSASSRQQEKEQPRCPMPGSPSSPSSPQPTEDGGAGPGWTSTRVPAPSKRGARSESEATLGHTTPQKEREATLGEGGLFTQQALCAGPVHHRSVPERPLCRVCQHLLLCKKSHQNAVAVMPVGRSHRGTSWVVLAQGHP